MARLDHNTNLTSTAIMLFPTQGFAATGLNQIVADSGAPLHGGAAGIAFGPATLDF